MTQWTQEYIQTHYIDAQVEESLRLDYKAAGALSTDDSKKKEITKDVSAMANSDGGILIYGVSEDPAQKYLPGKIDPIDRIEFSKERLEQVINGIRPFIKDILIHPVPLDTGPNDVLYVVEIPRSTTAHQAADYRYYTRYNFESRPMEDYRIREVMNRATTPEADIAFSCSPLDEPRMRLNIIVSNKGHQVIQNFKVEFTFPNLNSLLLYAPSKLGFVEFYKRPLHPQPQQFLEPFKDDPALQMYRVQYYSSNDVLFPNDSININSQIGLVYAVLQESVFQSFPQFLTIEWKLFADTMPFKSGIVSIAEIHRQALASSQ